MKHIKKISLIMNDNSYSGREYLSQLRHFNIDVICIGKFSKTNLIEVDRCGGFWKPQKQSFLEKHFRFFFFENLKSIKFINHLKKFEYCLGIQGGTGILKKNIINCFKFGIINFHPGDLPYYRGCSAPEYQYIDKKEVICTAHLINEEIDAGNIIEKRKLNLDYSSYFNFRASVYPEISLFVRDLIAKLVKDVSMIENSVAQNETEARYRKYIGDEFILKLKRDFKN